jgi:uncharacterized repeat protein (TIGR02543 family)
MTRTLLAACAVALVAAAPAAAQTDQNFEVPVDTDVVVNNDGSVDGADSSIDPEYNRTYGTQSAIDAVGCSNEPDKGLPDDGFFPARGTRPAIQLQTQNSNDGDNGYVLANDLDTFVVDVPDGAYTHLHLVAVTGAAETGHVEAEFTYTDGSTSKLPRQYRRFYYSNEGGALQNDMEFMTLDGSTCDEWNSVTIFAQRYVIDATKTLASVQITRRDQDVDGNRRITVFGGTLAVPRGLTVARAGSGSGTVSSPDGIACGDDCSESFELGRKVKLTATPAEGHTFTGWSGDCTGSGTTCEVEMSAARSVTATFDAPPPPPPQQQPPPPGPPLNQPTTRTVPFGSLVSARRSCARRRIRLAVDDVPGETIVEAIFRIGNRSRRRRTALIDDPFFFGRVSRRGFRLRVEMKTADGDTLRSSRRFKRCRPARRRRT